MIELQIETITTCSARCSFCVYPKLDRSGHTMPMDLFQKIIDEAVTIPQIERFVLHGLGEPTLDMSLEKRIQYVRERSTAPIEIYTHGAHLTPARFDSLKQAGLSSLIFSLNAVRQDQHQGLMGLVGKFDLVCRNIDYAIANRGNMYIEVHAVFAKDTFNDADAFAFDNRWGEYAKVIRENNWAGETRTLHILDGNECCGRALGQIYVLYDGRVSMCCYDPTGKTIFGDLKTQSIKEVYNSGYYSMFRQLHSADKAGVFKQCKNCTRT
jgi:MoaA/NifB/PqqE/SkfB family radical SAM enzyme